MGLSRISAPIGCLSEMPLFMAPSAYRWQAVLDGAAPCWCEQNMVIWPSSCSLLLKKTDLICLDESGWVGVPSSSHHFWWLSWRGPSSCSSVQKAVQPPVGFQGLIFQHLTNVDSWFLDNYAVNLTRGELCNFPLQNQELQVSSCAYLCLVTLTILSVALRVSSATHHWPDVLTVVMVSFL